MATDFYNLIRNEEIRNFFRENDVLGYDGDKAMLICHSYLHVDKKISLLRELSQVVNNDHIKEEIANSIQFGNEALEIIKKPLERCLYVLIIPGIQWTHDDEFCQSLYVYNDLSMYADTFEEVLNLAKSIDPNQSIEFGLEVIRFPEGKERNDEQEDADITVTLSWIDGKLDILGFDLYTDWKSLGVRSDKYNYFTRDFEHFPLPFEDGCQLKIQTPIMQKPIFGVLKKERFPEWGEEKDWVKLYGKKVLVEWTHELYPVNTPPEDRSYENNLDRIELTFQQIDMISEYSVLDWVERV